MKTTGHWLLVLVTAAMFGVVSSHLVLDWIKTISSLEDKVASGINDAVYSVSCHDVVVKTGPKKATSQMETVAQVLLSIFNMCLTNFTYIDIVELRYQPSVCSGRPGRYMASLGYMEAFHHNPSIV